MHAKVTHQERPVASASTPQAKASRSIGTRSHRLYGLTNPHQRARRNPSTIEICFNKNSKIPTINIFHENFKTSTYPKTCTPMYPIKNLSSPTQTRQEQKNHATLERITPAKRLYKPNVTSTPPGGRPTETSALPGFVRTLTKRFQQSNLPETFQNKTPPETRHAKVPHQERFVTNTRTPRAEASRSIGTQSHQSNDFVNPTEQTRLRADD